MFFNHQSQIIFDIPDSKRKFVRKIKCNHDCLKDKEKRNRDKANSFQPYIY